MPYYTQDPPGSPDGAGSGSSASGNTYTGEIGSIHVTLDPNNGSVSVSWSYQGSAGFEIEQKNDTDAGSNYFFVQGSSGRQVTVAGLQVGDDYGLRVRAIREDNTASDYEGTTVTLTAPSGPGASDVHSVNHSSLEFTVPSCGDIPAGYDFVSAQLQIKGDGSPNDAWVGFSGSWRNGIDPGETVTMGAGAANWPAFKGRVRLIYQSSTDSTLPQRYSGWVECATLTGNGTGSPPTVQITPLGSGEYTATWNGDDGGWDTVQIGIGDSSAGAEGDGFLFHSEWTLLPGGSVTFTVPGGNFAVAMGTTSTTSSNLTALTDVEPTVPAAPAYVSATVDPKDDTKVDVHWENTPEDETGYYLERSVDGGATWSPLHTPGPDSSSYTDDTIPFDSDGDADLKYRVSSVGTDSATVPTASTGGSISPTASHSQPTTSREIDDDRTTITSVTYVVGEQMIDPATQQVVPRNPLESLTFFKAVNGFYFSNSVVVKGTNLQNVTFLQYIHVSTTMLGFDGRPLNPRDYFRQTNPNPNDPMVNSPTYAVEGGYVDRVWTPMSPVHLQVSNDGRAGTLSPNPGEDKHWFSLHSGNFAFHEAYWTNLSRTSQSFRDVFTYPFGMNNSRKTSKTFSWGYSWGNADYKMNPPPAGVQVAASPAAPGNSASLLIGYNLDLSGVPYVYQNNVIP